MMKGEEEREREKRREEERETRGAAGHRRFFIVAVQKHSPDQPPVLGRLAALPDFC